MILADNYAEAVAGKPEMVKSRMNAIKRFYSSYSTNPPAADTICNTLYNVYVDNLERGNTERANAIKECFLALADKDNEKLGPLYATELVMAKENVDTTSIITYLPLLQEYAARNNFDYDDEIEEAAAFLHHVRTRPPIQDAIAGVWVSENIAGVTMPDGKFYYQYPEEKMNLINTINILQIRNKDSEVYKGKEKYIILEELEPDPMNNAHIDVLKQRKSLDAFPIYGDRENYQSLHAWELPAFNMNSLSQEYIDSTKPQKNNGYKFKSIWGNNQKEHISRLVIADDSTYSIYVFWGDERLKRNSAELGAFGRQTMQMIQANVAGHLSRSKYSFAETLTGNLATGLVGAGVNAIIDALMVSTEKIWSIETTLHLDNPNKLTAVTTTQLIVSKSNSTQPEVFTNQQVVNYYRWEPEDKVTFLSTDPNYYKLGTVGYHYPWKGIVELHTTTKEEKERQEQYVKDYSKKWKQWHKDQIKELQTKQKAYAKNSAEWSDLNAQIENLKKDPPNQMWQHWNLEMLNKLKLKANEPVSM